MTDLIALVDEVAERHYVERCAQVTDPQPTWEDLDPMLQHRLREWVMPTVAATVDLMVEAMKTAVDEERAAIVAWNNEKARVHWDAAKRVPEGTNARQRLELIAATYERIASAISSGAHDGGE